MSQLPSRGTWFLLCHLLLYIPLLFFPPLYNTIERSSMLTDAPSIGILFFPVKKGHAKRRRTFLGVAIMTRCYSCSRNWFPVCVVTFVHSCNNFVCYTYAILFISILVNYYIAGSWSRLYYRKIFLDFAPTCTFSKIICGLQVFLSMLVKVTSIDLPLWHRILVLEVLRVIIPIALCELAYTSWFSMLWTIYFIIEW